MSIEQRLVRLRAVVSHNSASKNLKRAAVFYRRIMMTEIAAYLDRVRINAADKQIIPNTTGMILGGYRQRKMQPSVPGKLTSRTGALVKMLKDKKSWSTSAPRVWRQEGGAVQGTVKVFSKGTDLVSEQFVGELKAVVREDSKYWPRVGGQLNKRIFGSAHRPTKQQLQMRFRWETGIRGSRRQFLYPAGEEEHLNTRRILQQKINQLEIMTGII